MSPLMEVKDRLLETMAQGPNWDRVASLSAALLPVDPVWRLFERATAECNIALCLHHVSRARRDWLTTREEELDEFIERALASRGPTTEPWLTVTFDDGYEDAWRYIRSRAPRYPNVDWMLFVCPEKVARQAGFRWDLGGDDPTSHDIRRENLRADLRDVTRFSECRVATVEQCRQLAELPNVRVGNHTNCHFHPADIPPDHLDIDLRQSHVDFERLFGTVTDFAFPFGTPEVDFNRRHVALLRELGDFNIWTTARRPFMSDQRRPGAVLPRFPVNGEWSAKQLAFWIALLSLRSRVGSPDLESIYPASNDDLERRATRTRDERASLDESGELTRFVDEGPPLTHRRAAWSDDEAVRSRAEAADA